MFCLTVVDAVVAGSLNSPRNKRKHVNKGSKAENERVICDKS